MDANDAVLVCKRTGQMLPFYKGAFQLAEGWPRKIRTQYKGALLIDEDGNVREIEDVHILGPYGQSRLSKMFSVLNGNWSVDVASRSQFKRLEELKEVVIQGLENDQNLTCPFFPAISGKPYLMEIRKLESVKDIFNYLGLSREMLRATNDEQQSPLLDSL